MLKTGDIIGELGNQYKILYEVSKTRDACVYLGMKLETREIFAIKIIERTSESEELVKSFRNEAKRLQELRDPRIIRLLHFGITNEYLYIVMEYVPGKNLSELTQNRQISEVDALKVIREVGEALKIAHRHGVMHNDIKPTNIIATPTGGFKLIDFGMATKTHQSTNNQFGGTLNYMAPERVDPNRFGGPGFRSDIYALGAVLYELLGGRPPFQEVTSPLQLAMDIVTHKPIPLTRLRHGNSQDVEAVVAKCLEKNPADRYATADELIVAIDKILNEDTGCRMVRQSKIHIENGEWDEALNLARGVRKESKCFQEAEKQIARAQRLRQEDKLTSLEMSLESAFRTGDWNVVDQVVEGILLADPGHVRAKGLKRVRDQMKDLPKVWGLDVAYLESQSKTKYPTTGSITTIGRSVSGATAPGINLGAEENGDSVSRRHVQIIHEQDKWSLYVETSSRNPTLVNGIKLEKGQRRLLVNGDQLQFGDVAMTFHTETEPEPTQEDKSS